MMWQTTAPSNIRVISLDFLCFKDLTGIFFFYSSPRIEEMQMTEVRVKLTNLMIKSVVPQLSDLSIK
jgi:hypothetical protein